MALVIPPPCDLAQEGSFSYAQLVNAYKSLSVTNGIPIYRTDALFGTWSLANTAGITDADGLHYKASAYAAMGPGIAAMVRDIAKTNFAA